jgi:hypothetical protein
VALRARLLLIGGWVALLPLPSVAADEAGAADASATPAVVAEQPVPPALRQQADEAVAYFGQHLAGKTPEQTKLLRCFTERLRKPDADDRLIPWTRICPRSGPSQAVCEATATDEAQLAARIRGVADVEGANAGLERKFILHLASELLAMKLYFPVVLYEGGVLELYAARLVSLADDARLAHEELRARAEQKPHYRALLEWVEQRQKDARSVYGCLAAAP